MAQNGAEFGKSGYATDKDMCFCPFHEHSHNTPSVGITYRKGKAFFNCFACGAAGDAVKYAELYYKITPIEAAKKVCTFLGIPYEESEEAKEKASKIVQERKAAAQKAKEKFEKEEAKIREASLKRALPLVPKLQENFITMWDAISEDIKTRFPTFHTSHYHHYSNLYLGWDADHQSVVIINQYKKKLYNIKWRQKYAAENNNLTDKRMGGKWIGLWKARYFPFPLERFEEHEDSRVIICEGEKDALNLLFLGVNCLTLGAATNSWEEYADLLKGKDIYVWFDHDKAGYTGAVRRYKELESTAKSIHIILFYTFKEKYPDNFDISDYLQKQNFKCPDELYESVSYSTYKLTNDRLGDIEEICNLDLCEFYESVNIKDFRDIKKELLKKDDEDKVLYVVNVKGEGDDNRVDHVLSQMDRYKKTDTWRAAKEVFAKYFFENGEDGMFKDIHEAIDTMDNALTFKKTVINNYRQTHLTDCANAFIAMVKKAGFDIGEYKSSIYIWTGSYYLQVSDNDLAKFIHTDWMNAARVDMKKRTRSMAEDIVVNIKSLATNLDEIKKYEQRRVVNCINGTIFVSHRGKTTFSNKHDKKNAAINILPFEYDKNASAPKWEKFLRQVLPNEQERMALMEFIGYCFLPAHEFETFLFLYGKSGANGKSVILDTIRNFFGSENVSALQLQQFEGHQLDAITGKLINIGSEIDKTGTDRGQWAILKALVSNNDSITVNPKNKDPYELTEKPKLVFSGNDKPKGGLDNGVFRRMLLLSFSYEIKDEEKIRDLSDRFKDEMAGIFNLAISGLKRIKENGRFTRSDRMIEELETYKDEVNPLRSFIKEAIIPNRYCCVPHEYMYKLYVSYIKNRGGNPMGNISFFRSFREELNMLGTKTEVKTIRPKKTLQGLSSVCKCTSGVMISSDFEITAINIDNNTTIETKDMNISSLTIESIKSEKDE